MSETPLWPCTERNGVSASEDVDSLLKTVWEYLYGTSIRAKSIKLADAGHFEHTAYGGAKI